MRAQRSVSFLQTPAWAGVKTEWHGESIGWFDGRRSVPPSVIGGGTLFGWAEGRWRRARDQWRPTEGIVNDAGPAGRSTVYWRR